MFSLIAALSAHAQGGGAGSPGGGAPDAAATVPFGELLEGTRFIPGLNISERYDSNVWYGFVPEGARTYDYVSNVSPMLTIQHNGAYGQGTIVGGPSAEFYMNNDKLNYIGANALMNFNLSNLVQRLDRRLSLTVADQFIYTNQLQAFVPTVPGQNPLFPGTPVGSGIQPFRTTSTINTARLTGSYELAPKVSFQASYMNSIVRFAGTFGSASNASVFGSTFHTISAGPQVKISPRDTVGVNYLYSYSTFSTGSEVGAGTFATQGGTVSWNRIITPSLTGSVSGGLTILQPTEGQEIQGSNLLYLMSASLLWNLGKNSNVTLAYSRSVIPSFFIEPVPLISDVVTLSAAQQLTPRMRAGVTGNFANNEDTASTTQFQSYGGSVTLTYDISRAVSAFVSYTYYDYKSRFLDQRINFDRNVLMLSLRMVWN